MATEFGEHRDCEGSEISVSVAGSYLPDAIQYGNGDNGDNRVPETEASGRFETGGQTQASGMVGAEVFQVQSSQGGLLPGSTETQATGETQGSPETPTSKENYVYNITTGRMTRVLWDGIPLIETSTGRILQIHLFSPIMNQWIKLAPEKFDEPGVVVVTPEELFQQAR